MLSLLAGEVFDLRLYTFALTYVLALSLAKAVTVQTLDSTQEPLVEIQPA
ncbi:hypothetical protein QFZ79_004114 [Arthrobacter sp. V4I6]|nr:MULTISPECIES: hypothetical protein [unclassified Arthrobacter]MDQ0821739.1 hypothetical protein [Arthrobacter sp. V1I7]MDQ0856003.1 hypothetical protein [Arthrobacter sp. V4I6]